MESLGDTFSKQKAFKGQHELAFEYHKLISQDKILQEYNKVLEEGNDQKAILRSR